MNLNLELEASAVNSFRWSKEGMGEKKVTKKKIRPDLQEKKKQMPGRQKQPLSLCE